MQPNARQLWKDSAGEPAARTDKPASQPVYLFMDSPLVRLPTNMTVKGARQVMTWKRADYCLVSEGGRVLGVLANADLANARDTDRAWDWTRRSLSGVNANASAAEALARMEREDVTFLLVSAGPVLLGIVTEQRLRGALGRGASLVQRPFGPRISTAHSSTALH